jgi:serine/threonine protein kinase
VRGPNLSQVLKARSRLTETELLFVMRQICSGLDAAHAEGIIHRDLKPSNLLVAASADAFESFQKGVCTSSFLLEGKVKITDFGISKLLASRAQGNSNPGALGVTWSSAGTPLFMSPEQFQGLPSTPETDIYALGVVAYQALSGALPFDGESVEVLARKHISEAPKPLTECSPRINRAILRAMAKKPEDRFPSARAFLAALEGADEKTVVLSGLPPAPPKAYFLVPLVVFAAIVVVLATRFFVLHHAPVNRVNPAYLSPNETTPPSLGKRITLPEDMDVLPEITSLPSPSPVPPPQPALPGPRQPRISWTALLDSESELDPWVDGVGPDGTIYIREDMLHTLWAVSDGVLRWGYRASNDRGIDSLIDRSSHADFRDPGRMWLAWCPDDSYHPRSRCSGTVFNAAGVGGHISRLPAAIGLQQTAFNVTRPFTESDAQQSHWPEDQPLLFATSRLGKVTLTDRGSHWTLPLDSHAAFAIDQGNGFIVSTASGTIQALNSAGQIQWTYKLADAPSSLQSIPNGDLIILERDQQTISCIRAGNLRWQYHSGQIVEEFADHVTESRRIVVADKDSTLYFLTSAGSSSAHAIDSSGKILWNLPWVGAVSYGALALDSRGRLFFTFQLYEINRHSRGGVICITN